MNIYNIDTGICSSMEEFKTFIKKYCGCGFVVNDCTKDIRRKRRINNDCNKCKIFKKTKKMAHFWRKK